MLLLGNGARADDGPNLATMNQAAKAVVQILARDCGGGPNRTGTGFLWQNTGQVVTALHVISGCRNISAYFNQTAGVRVATPSRALKAADLALLTVPPAPGTQALSSVNANPAFNSTLQVIGYYFGVGTYDSRPLRVTLGSGVLQAMLPASAANALIQSGGPDPKSLQIVRLDGNLLPGLSGAPLIDASGNVAGIGSGGLENGAVGVSWAVRASYLASLANAPPYSGGYAKSVSNLFSAPEEGVAVAGVRCGSALFYKAKSRTLAALMQTTDDPTGLAQLASTTGMANDELLALELDIYTEPKSGASVAVPVGVALKPVSGGCRAEVAPGIRVRLSSASVSDPGEIQQQSVAFESGFPTNTGLFWMPDPSFTYLAPINRADGLVVRRKTGVGFTPGTNIANGEVFETIMARRDLFVGVEVLNTAFSPPLYQQCRFAPQSQGCAEVNQVFRRWVASVLGTHLSTFPLT